MVITLARNSYTITDMAISNIHYKHSKPLYYLLASIIVYLLFVSHTEILENFLCVTRIATVAITIAGGVILADLEDELTGQAIRFILNLILEK